jgi:hypothetical protein
MFSRWKHIFQGIVRSGQKRRIWLISRGSGILPFVQDHRKRGLYQLLGLESEMAGSFREDLGDFSFKPRMGLAWILMGFRINRAFLLNYWD